MTHEVQEIIEYKSVPGISIRYENAPISFPAHWHSAAEFSAVLKDDFRVRIKDTDFIANKGDIILFWPREIHEIVSVPVDGTIFIQFSPSLLESNLDLVSISRLMTSCHHIKASEEPELAASIRDRIMKIRDTITVPDHLNETRCKLIIYEIALLIGEYAIREYREQFKTDRVADQAWSHMRIICNYIAEHSSEDITETDVAAAVGLSPHYFSRLFKKYMQTSFPSYLSAVRVRTALRLLADDELSITECAYSAGFQSTTTFNRVFHEVTGYTPREYRKLHI